MIHIQGVGPQVKNKSGDWIVVQTVRHLVVSSEGVGSEVKNQSLVCGWRVDNTVRLFVAPTDNQSSVVRGEQQ